MGFCFFMGIRKDLTNKRVGYLTILYLNESGENKRTEWICKCDCGVIKSISACRLLSNKTKSCGCMASYMTSKSKIIHGLSHTRIAGILNGIIQRCVNPNVKKYNIYGGRGIRVCEEWLNNSSSFFNWAFANGYSEELQIDRIDVNGDYEPSNCRWVTAKQQCYNKRTNVYVTYRGVTKTIAEWCIEINISQGAFWQRKNIGWSYDRIIETPILKTWSRRKKQFHNDKV